MSTFRDTYSKEQIKKIQRALNEICYGSMGFKALNPDGAFGNLSIQMLKLAQQICNQPITGVFEGIVKDRVEEIINTKYITDEAIRELAVLHGIEYAMIKAIFEVESRGSGFLPSGDPVILFERHIMRRELIKKKGGVFTDQVLRKYPDVVNISTGAYKGGQAEWDRLRSASEIDEECALRSASWGLGQVMGFHSENIGFSNVFEMVDACKISEKNQLDVMIRFLKSEPSILRGMKEKDFHAIARGYNGKNYANHNYHTRLQDAYNKYK